MAEPSEAGGEPGLPAALRRLFATGLALLQVRIELVGTEFEQEKLRLIGGLMWAAVALLLLGVGLVLLAFLVVLLFWDGHRVAALGILTLLFIAAGAGLWRTAVARLRNPAGLLALTADELARDRAALGGD